MPKSDIEFLFILLGALAFITWFLLRDIKEEIERQGNRITAALNDNRDFLREIDQSLDEIKSTYVSRSESD
jgi:hypothetical protein